MSSDERVAEAIAFAVLPWVAPIFAALIIARGAAQVIDYISIVKPNFEKTPHVTGRN